MATATGTSRVALVTGASSGIGEASARALQQRGFVVYGVARRVDRLKALHDSGIRTLSMDVTDEESMIGGLQRILAEAGRIDVLVNNAGYGSYGAIEDVPLDEARRQFEVNVFGAARMAQLVLPHMRKQRKGMIINVTSMGGKIYSPLGGWYHGTKFALEAVSDCMRIETRPFGVDVVVVEPGEIRTEWGGIAAENLRQASGSGPYSGQAEVVANTLGSEAVAKRSSPPELIARAVAKAATARRPKTRYALGFGAKPVILLRRWLPDRAYDAFIRRATGLR